MNKQPLNTPEIKAILGLGNPGPKFHFTPHNIGFLIVDALCDQYHGFWQEKKDMHVASIIINEQQILLVKPQTFMNNSGQILAQLHKQGVRQENILVIHDEIDFAFGKISLKQAGSARGHNGLRSLIAYGGDNFLRLRVGVGRPDEPSQVGNFVTARFIEPEDQVQELIHKACETVHTHALNIPR